MEIPFAPLSPSSKATSGVVSEIKNQLDALLSIVAQQEEDLREARMMLRRANTEVMLYGKAPPPDDTALLGAGFESEFFIVAAMELVDKSQLFFDNDSGRFSQRYVEMMKSAIYGVFEAALGPYSIATCCESDTAFANILINLPDEDQAEERMLQALDAAMQDTVALIARNYGVNLVVAMSPIVQGHEKLPYARITVNNLIRQQCSVRRIANTRQVHPVPSDAAPPPDAKLEKQFYQYILSRDFEMAQMVLEKLTVRDLQTPELPFELAKLRFLNHMEGLLNVLGISAIDVNYLYLRPLDTKEELLELLRELFEDLETRMRDSDQAQQSKIEDIARYITEHYADCDLCLAKLCDLFDMNQSYLSRSFKQIYGIGVLTFIHTQRLVHVKEKLENSENSIDEIWSSCGYTNRRTFNRTFRKLEGKSASEYRKAARGEGVSE